MLEQKPVRYFVVTEKRPSGYVFESNYSEHANIINRAQKRGDKIKFIASSSTSTGKTFETKRYINNQEVE